MSHISSLHIRALALMLASAIAAAPAFADKPSWAGERGKGRGDEGRQGQERRHEAGREREGPRGDAREHFGERHRMAVRDFYAGAYREGRCPPGLAKKHNGCMPPGQARKWELGRPLPQGVVYYEVPHALVVQLGPPPSGYRYVRVAGDILMIAVGSAMVVDAIRDLGR